MEKFKINDRVSVEAIFGQDAWDGFLIGRVVGFGGEKVAVCPDGSLTAVWVFYHQVKPHTPKERKLKPGDKVLIQTGQLGIFSRPGPEAVVVVAADMLEGVVVREEETRTFRVVSAGCLILLTPVPEGWTMPADWREPALWALLEAQNPKTEWMAAARAGLSVDLPAKEEAPPESKADQGREVAEQEVLNHLADAWNVYQQIEPRDDYRTEFCQAIHRAQHLVGVLTLRRLQPAWWS